MADNCRKPSKRLTRCGRRRSKSLGRRTTSDLDICETIPTTLAVDERLQILLKLAFEHSLYTAGQELESVDGFCFGDLLDDGKMCYKKISEQLQQENICKLATANELRDRCDDMTCEECHKIEDCTTIIGKMQDESRIWDQVLSSEREKLQEAANFKPTPLEYDKKSNDEYDYTFVMSKVDSLYHASEVLAGDFSQAGCSLDQCIKLSQAHIKNLNSKASGFLDTGGFSTPKTLIKHVTQTNGSKSNMPP